MKVFISLLLSFGLAFASVALNTASEKQLTSLQGVGVKKAQEIVDYRKSNGCFKRVADIVNVKGIGQKTFEKNKDNLELGECPQ